jgi:isoamylase
MTTFVTTPGTPLPLGAWRRPPGINFSLFSRHGRAVSLLLFESGRGDRLAEIALDPAVNRTGDIWHILVHDLDPAVRYGYRVDGPCEPRGSGHFFNPGHILLDPYARALSGGTTWGKPYRRRRHEHPDARFLRRCCVCDDEFDWEGDRPLNIPLQDSVIYELHVRGFTVHPGSGVDHPGTYGGVVEKIPYLKELGVTAVELLPVAEFNEDENVNIDPGTGVRLKNFWGYSTLAFFAPKAAYAVDGRNGRQVREFKEMVKALHRAGIEVILDVVFNHTAEGGGNGPVFSFRGLDNTIYYLLDPETREYLNFSGCGNTTNCNHPLVRSLIMDCLHYWVTEMHVDGFRFDLASILGRDRQGRVLANPPMVEQIAEDPVLAHTKIIAEAWDAAGLYQVGSFSTSSRWAEWNGRFRDEVRAFMAGHSDSVAALATRLAGSSDLYQDNLRHPYNSINYVTCHDGFTLSDLVSYDRKHNLPNGENNRDGSDHNLSWNSGAEGETTDPEINRLRERRMRTFAVILFLSQGVPMFVAGDEFGRTQRGNNNAYCQDSDISWLDWGLAEKNKELLRFFRLLISLRKDHPVFRRATFFASPEAGEAEISWHSPTGGPADWSPAARTLAFLLRGAAAAGTPDHDFYVMLNSQMATCRFQVPAALPGRPWLLLVDTAAPPPGDISPAHEALPLKRKEVAVAGMGAVVLMRRRQ